MAVSKWLSETLFCFKPCEETSITACVIPESTISRSIFCSSSGPGVVCDAVRICVPKQYLIVLKRPVGNFASLSMASIRKAVVVLPFVPVMPIRVRSFDG